MARSPATLRQPARANAKARAADRDREKRALDFAARRVPVWQVSTVTILRRIYDARPVGGDDLATFTAIRAALEQVPPEVTRAAELHMRGEWKPA